MKITTTPYIYILFFLFSFSTTMAQEFHLSLIANDSKNSSTLEKLNYQTNHINKDSIIKEMAKIQDQLEMMGFLNVRLDSTSIKDSLYIAYFKLNQKIEKIKIYYKNDSISSYKIPKKLIQQISIKSEKDYFEIKFSQISSSLNRIVAYYEEKGNSFVEASLRKIHLENESAFAFLLINDTRSRTIDQTIIRGYEKFPKNFIKYNFNLKQNSVFNTKKLKDASMASNRLSFIEEQKPPEVLFTKDSTYIYMYLKKKPSNRFDGVLGFSSKKEGSGLDINGYLDFEFNNIFNSGESIALLWKKNSNESQRLLISANAPYLFNLPIIPKVTFDIFRQDSTFNNIHLDLRVGYILNIKNEISAIYNSENSNDLTSNNLGNSTISAYKNYFFGMNYRLKIPNNDLLFPEKTLIDISLSMGSRDTDTKKTNQYKVQMIGNFLYSFNNKHHLFIQNQSGVLTSDDYLMNELFRIGGVESIRGINEDSIFASEYSIFNFEYRFKTNNLSYLFSITDFAYTNNKIFDQGSKIYSFGMGYSFITKVGILKLSYVIPKIENSPFKIDVAKLNINITSIF